MTLKSKLRPDTSTGGGKVGPCERCKYPKAEFVTANFQVCPRCDKPKPPPLPPPEFEFDLDLDDEKTDPGWGAPATGTMSWLPAGTAPYRCIACFRSVQAKPSAVAAGLRCTCGGSYYRLP